MFFFCIYHEEDIEHLLVSISFSVAYNDIEELGLSIYFGAGK